MKVQQSSLSDYYLRLNFHPLSLNSNLIEWLKENYPKPLVLQGEIGSGRSYLVRAGAFSIEKHKERPYQVVVIDCGLQAAVNLETLVDYLASNNTCSAQDCFEVATIIKSFFGSMEIGLNVLVLPFLSIALSLKDGKTFLQQLLIETRELPKLDPFVHLRQLLDMILENNHLILVLENSDELDHGMKKEWLDLLWSHNSRLRAGSDYGNLLLVFSISTDLGPGELLSLDSDEYLAMETTPLTEDELRIILDQRFSPNRFSEDFIGELHWYGKALEFDELGYPALLAGAMGELLNKKLIIWDEESWQINPYKPEEELEVILGKPLRKLITARIDSLDPSLRSQVNRYLSLAALCRQTVPQMFLLDYMTITDKGERNKIIDAIDDNFVDAEPAILVDEGYSSPWLDGNAVYCFKSPLSTVALRNRLHDPQQEATRLLEFLAQRLDIENRSVAGLLWRLADQANGKIREQWREKLDWYFAPELADQFSAWLEEQLSRGRVSVRSILQQASQLYECRSPLFFQAVVTACDHWYKSHEGVPWSEEGALFFNAFGLMLNQQGQYHDALGKMELALNIWEQLLSSDHPVIATALDNIGLALEKVGRHQEALKKREQALCIRKNILPADHPHIAQSLDNLGVVLGKLGRNQEALEKMEQALIIREKVLPGVHPHIAQNLNNIGHTLGEIGRHQEALEKMEQALTIREKVLTADHPDIAQSLDNLGVVLGKLGRNQEALEKMKQALTIREKALPADHPDIAQSLNNIGYTLGEFGQHQEALEKMELALNIQEKIMPPDHPIIAISLNNIGYTLGELGRSQEALEKMEQALTIREKVLPPDHPDIALSLNNIGYTLDKLGQHQEALEKMERALHLWEKVLPPDHSDIEICRNTIASIRKQLDR